MKRSPGRGHEAENMNCRLIAVTGGPGAGKTAVLELARKSLGGHVAVLPEAASIVFGGGFPRRNSEPARVAAQTVIFHTQLGLEKIAVDERQVQLALCDRGTLDGLAYWPGREAKYWQVVGSSQEEQLARYEAVIHLRTPLAEQGYNHSNPIRIETNEQAVRIDEKLFEIWSGHPRRYVIESADDFLAKAKKALAIIEKILEHTGHPGASRVLHHKKTRAG